MIFLAIDGGDGRREERRAFGRAVRDAGRGEHLLDRLLRRRRRQERLVGRRRIGERRQRQAEPAAAGGGLQIRNRLVEQREHLPHFGLAEAVMILRPFAERRPRALDDREPRLRVRRPRDVAQRRRDVVRERRVVGVGLRPDVALRLRGGRVAARAVPVDARDREVHQVERRVRLRRRRHREDDAVADARRFAVAHERRAVGEEHAEHRIVGGRRHARREDQRRREDGGAHPTALHEASSVVCGPDRVKHLWRWLKHLLKSC